MVYLGIWLLDVYTSLSFVFRFLTFASFCISAMITVGIVFIAESDTFDEFVASIKENMARVKKLYVITLILIFTSVLLPSKTTVHIMAGVYVSKQVLANEHVTEIGSKVYKSVNKYLDAYLQEEPNKE